MSADSGTEGPRCPDCGSDDGFLGTQGAYFCCRPCGAKVERQHRERYWTPDHEPLTGKDFNEAVKLSPWGRP